MQQTDISFSRIHKLAIPAIIAGIAEPILSITDTAIVGNLNENATEALAATGIVGAFISMLIWVLGQTRSAISSILAQYLGANKLDAVKKLPAQAIVLVLAISLIILGVTYPFSSAIFKAYNASGLILEYCNTYYKIRVFGFPFTLFTFAIFGIFRGLQNTYYPMVIAITGALLNIILDYVLVYGFLQYIPAMHLKGAAYASVIAQIIMALMASYFLWKKTNISLKIEFPLHHEIKNLTLMVLNLFVRTLALNTALYLSNAFATSYGTNYIAAYTITFNIWLFAAFFIDGYSSAGNILSGKLLGEKNHKKLVILIKKLALYGVLLSVILCGIAGILYTNIGLLFTKESGVLDTFYAVFWMIIAMQPICAIAFILDGTFKGLGHMKDLRNVLLVATFLGFVPCLFILDYFDFKLHGIWISFFIWLALRAGLLAYRFRKKYVLKNSLH